MSLSSSSLSSASLHTFVMQDMRNFNVYLLRLFTDTTKKRGFYVGMTNNPHTRIAQHNRLTLGGANKTTKKCTATERWEFVLVISGFPTKKMAEAFEKTCQHAKPVGPKKRRGRRPTKKALANAAAAAAANALLVVTAAAAGNNDKPKARAPPKPKAPRPPPGEGFARDYDFNPALMQHVTRNASGQKVHISVLHMLRTLSMKQVSRKSPPAYMTPLTVNWFAVDDKPVCAPGCTYLPAHASERIVEPDERAWVYTRRPGENAIQYTYEECRKARMASKAKERARKKADAAALAAAAKAIVVANGKISRKSKAQLPPSSSNGSSNSSSDDDDDNSDDEDSDSSSDDTSDEEDDEQPGLKRSRV
jgi:predicted GIY-YIG superfamily endonuclease